MSKTQSLSFGVRTLDGCTAASWYVATGDDSSFYVGCRGLGGDFKLSFHASGECNYSITEISHKNFEPGDAPPGRYIEWWAARREHACARSCSIIVPPAGVVGTAESHASVHWVLSAQPGMVIEFLILASRVPIISDDPAKCILDSMPLANGQGVWVLVSRSSVSNARAATEWPGPVFHGRQRAVATAGTRQLGFIGYSVRETDRLRILVDTITIIARTPERSGNGAQDTICPCGWCKHSNVPIGEE